MSSRGGTSNNNNSGSNDHHDDDRVDVDDVGNRTAAENRQLRIEDAAAPEQHGDEDFVPYAVGPPTEEQAAFQKRCEASFERNAPELVAAALADDAAPNDPPSENTEGVDALKDLPASLEFHRLMRVNSFRYETGGRVGWIVGCGDNEYGSLGRHMSGTRQNATTGIRLLNPNLFDAHIRQISCGALASAALSVYGVVYTFGVSDHGALGRTFPAHLNPDRKCLWEATPAPLDGAPPGIRQVACGKSFGLGLTENGLVYTWGCKEDNNNQRFKTTPTGSRDGPAGWNETPVQVPGLSNIVQVFTGPDADFCFALALDGTLYSWGTSPGALVDSSSRCCWTCRPHRSLTHTHTHNNTCFSPSSLALSFPRTGFGNCGELGRIFLQDPKSRKPSASFELYTHEVDGEMRIRESVLKEFLVPKPVPLPSKKVISVACGANFAVVVARNDQNFGITYSAGNNRFGQLGKGRASVPAAAHDPDEEANQLDLLPVRCDERDARAK
jgi:Regulator of chromosome condensation (RCC1) repeat